MRSTMLVVAGAMALAGCSMMPFGGGSAEAPTAAATATPPTTAPMVATAPEAQAYEIQHVVRGPVRRVKVLFNGRTVETLTMSKGRTATTSHCCSADGCETIIAPKKNEPVKACTTFKMVCDADGACKEDAPAKASSKI